MFPPSTVNTAPVVFFEIARWKNAFATSSAFTSLSSRLPLIYSSVETSLAFARDLIIPSFNKPLLILSAFTPFDLIPILYF